MSGFTRDSPQISASPHQLDLAPYASGPYNAQWNAPGILHDKHTLRSSRILGEMEVDEPWLGLWLPLNYQIDMGASQHRTLELGWILQAFSPQNSFLGWCFWFVLKVVFVIGSAVDRLCGCSRDCLYG